MVIIWATQTNKHVIYHIKNPYMDVQLTWEVAVYGRKWLCHVYSAQRDTPPELGDGGEGSEVAPTGARGAVG